MSQPTPTGVSQQNNTQPMVRPEQVDKLPNLSEQVKTQYKEGLASLWQAYENNPPGSEEHMKAEGKIKVASLKLMQNLVNARANRPVSGGGQRPNVAQQSNMQVQQNPMSQPQMVQAHSRLPFQGGQQAQQQAQPQGQQQAPQNVSLSQPAQQDLDSVNLIKPAQVAPQQFDLWKMNWRKEAYTILHRRDQIMMRARQLNQQSLVYKSNGSAIPPMLAKQFEEAKKALDTVNNKWKNHRSVGEGQQPQVQQRPGMQPGVNTSQQPPLPQPQPQPQQADAKPVNMDQRTSLSPSQASGNFQQHPQPGQNQQGAPAQMGQQNNQQQAQSSQMPLQQTQPTHNFSQQQNTQQQPTQQRPQINTTQIQNSNGMGGPPQNSASVMPSSAPQNSQRPQPLNHQQALSQAAANYSQSQAQQGQQTPGQVPNGVPFNQQPSSATQQQTPNSAYPNLQTTQTSSANTKFPIPKTLQLDPRTQTPVAGPPSRPTLTSQGMMHNPGVHRVPPFQLNGEGDRVLSKSKLDELVRQVTGAAPGSDSESSSVLARDVEESVLRVADNFIDDVITGACRLAKLRPNQTLDIRDIQMVLERNYGIRIPGYGLDEVRTVRKFQPAPGWHSKMQAIQAAKVMGARDP